MTSVIHTTGMIVAAMSWNLMQHWCSVRTSSCRYFPVSSCSTLFVLTTSFFNTNTICVQKSKLLNTIRYTESFHLSDFLSSRSHNNFTDVTRIYYILFISVKLNLDLESSYLFNVSGGDKVKSQGQGLLPHF